MHTTIMIFVATLRETFLSRASLHLENLALRQQVAILKRERRRPWLQMLDRLFWVIISRLMAALARGAGDRKAGNRHRLAPEGISCVLDLEIQARQTRAASGAQRCPRTHPSNVSGEPIVGCSSHPRRTHEIGNRGIGGDCIEVHVAVSEATVADVADVPYELTFVIHG